MGAMAAQTFARRTFRSSDLSRDSVAVFAAAEEAPVEVTRRDGRDLVLMSRQESDARDALLQFAAQLIAASLDDDKDSLGDRLADRFDWMLVFSAEVREQCAQAIVRAARASFSTGQAHLAIAEMASWRSTAEAVAAGLDQVEVEWLEEHVVVSRPE